MKETASQLASIDIEVWLGLLAAILTFITEIILCSKGIITFKGERRLKKAKELGHVVQGRRVSWQLMNEDDGKQSTKYVGRYEYSVNGHIYRGMVISLLTIPNEEVDFYYLSDPKKAFTEADAAKKPGMILLYIIPFVVAYLVMKLMGWQPS